MSSTSLSGINLEDNSYTVKQKVARNAYVVKNSGGEEVLRSKQKLFKMKEEFPFVNPGGEEIFSIKAQQIMDIAGDYVLEDCRTEETISIISEEFSLLVQKWEIKTPDGELLARVQSRGKIFGLLRFASDIFQLLPHAYTIEGPEGEMIGKINGKFGLRDRYEIEIEDESVRKEALLASAIAIDAIEGN